jgi:transcriptional regulator with XRE-family HTH domain
MTKRVRQRWFLKEWRKHRAMTQQQLADALDTTTSRISELETGSERYNQDILESLAKALSLPEDPVTPADLLSRRPGDPASPFDLWDRIPERERAKAARIVGRVLEDFAAPYEAEPPPPPEDKKRRS